LLRPGEKVERGCEISLSGGEHPFVSRGGIKLDAAIAAFGIPVRGRRALDIGQSTGGFTHCLLLRGAGAVVGVDVGHDQLAEPLRRDPRVASLEKQDIRTLRLEQVAPPFELFVVDLSFISLKHVLPGLERLLAPRAEGVLLVKPQFEVGPDKIGSGGIVRDAAAREAAVEDIRAFCGEKGFTVAGIISSPITGGEGNQEFLFHLRVLDGP
jgi:23S rRNA (cytidine1920-2'-O)/16S rRNA (cytidine1409-2'-O)-methyltransferase